MATILLNGRPSQPSGYKVKPQSYARLEGIADELRPHLPVQSGERFRLDCQRILEGTLQQAGYRFKVAYANEMQEYAAFTIPGEYIIVFRDDVYDLLLNDNVYARSTVVHEMSHIVLQHSVTLHRGAEPGQHRFCEDSEWQAKALTAATMMPIAACREVGSAQIS